VPALVPAHCPRCSCNVWWHRPARRLARRIRLIGPAWMAVIIAIPPSIATVVTLLR
jgi:hypothetical protein